MLFAWHLRYLCMTRAPPCFVLMLLRLSGLYCPSCWSCNLFLTSNYGRGAVCQQGSKLFEMLWLLRSSLELIEAKWNKMKRSSLKLIEAKWSKMKQNETKWNKMKQSFEHQMLTPLRATLLADGPLPIVGSQEQVTPSTRGTIQFWQLERH